ncbi:MAG: F0F1 ATP synthase subunit A [Atopobiaceae bacterium]|jgi:F-type H+-transporting ATPase subunit a
MNPLDGLNDAVDELLDSFMTHNVIGSSEATLTSHGLTQYIFWMFVAIALLFIVLFVFKKKQSEDLVPHGFFTNAVESIIVFARDDLCRSILPDTWKKHFPFIFAIFFFILANNIVGIIPGAHPGTGTIGVTAALACYSFVYFIVVGCRSKGVWGYIKSLAPEGVVFPLNVLVWIIEVFSTFLRLITLAVRLFCNMFAGHVVMGTFAILASLFFDPLMQALSGSAALTATALGDAGASALWIVVLIIIYLVEILVAVIQAYVFSLLTAVYIQTAEDAE